MSQHASLRIDSVGIKHRNVLKRLERIKRLKKENRWAEERSMFGLPKVKSQKIKVKSSSADKAKGAEEGKAEAAKS